MKRKQVCSWHEPKMDGYTAALCLRRERYVKPIAVEVEALPPWREVVRVSPTVVKRPALQAKGGSDEGRA